MSKQIRLNSFFLGNELNLRLPYDSDLYHNQVLLIGITYEMTTQVSLTTDPITIAWQKVSNPEFTNPPEEKYDVPVSSDASKFDFGAIISN